MWLHAVCRWQAIVCRLQKDAIRNSTQGVKTPCYLQYNKNTKKSLPSLASPFLMCFVIKSQGQSNNISKLIKIIWRIGFVGSPSEFQMVDLMRSIQARYISFRRISFYIV